MLSNTENNLIKNVKAVSVGLLEQKTEDNDVYEGEEKEKIQERTALVKLYVPLIPYPQ